MTERGKDILTVAKFLAWHERIHLQGGVIAIDAFNAFCRLVELPPDWVMSIARGEYTPETPDADA